MQTPLDRAKTHPGAETMRATQGDKMDIIIAVRAVFVSWLLVRRFRNLLSLAPPPIASGTQIVLLISGTEYLDSDGQVP